MMFKIKSVPSDFKVDELYNVPEKDDSGIYSYFVIRKENMNTLDVLSLISRKLRFSFNRIGYSGLKDKSSISSQLVSFKGLNRDLIEHLNIPGISASFVGKGYVPVTLGSHKGNMFTIVVRNISGSIRTTENAFAIPNYFGSQRFSRANHFVGRAIIKGDFQEACRLVSEDAILGHLEERKNDFVGALSCLGRNKLTFYVHSYQAFLFNKCISSYLKSHFSGRDVDDSGYKLFFPDCSVENIKIPIVGFTTELENTEASRILLDIMRDEGLSFRDFVVKKIPALSSEGAVRDMMMAVRDFKCEFSDDEFNEGMKKCVLKFSLDKASYATVVVNYLFA